MAQLGVIVSPPSKEYLVVSRDIFGCHKESITPDIYLVVRARDALSILQGRIISSPPNKELPACVLVSFASSSAHDPMNM